MARRSALSESPCGRVDGSAGGSSRPSSPEPPPATPTIRRPRPLPRPRLRPAPDSLPRAPSLPRAAAGRPARSRATGAGARGAASVPAGPHRGRADRDAAGVVRGPRRRQGVAPRRGDPAPGHALRKRQLRDPTDGGSRRRDHVARARDEPRPQQPPGEGALDGGHARRRSLPRAHGATPRRGGWGHRVGPRPAVRRGIRARATRERRGRARALDGAGRPRDDRHPRGPVPAGPAVPGGAGHVRAAGAARRRRGDRRGPHRGEGRRAARGRGGVARLVARDRDARPRPASSSSTSIPGTARRSP